MEVGFKRPAGDDEMEVVVVEADAVIGAHGEWQC